MSIFKIIIPLLIYSSSYGQGSWAPIKDWKSYLVPTNEDTIYKYSLDDNNWFVNIDNDEIYVVSDGKYVIKTNLPFEIKPTNKEEGIFYGKRSVLKVDDGFLIGFNRGEWGGGLYWFSNDGTNKYKISNDQIVQFKMRDQKIYAVQGLAHMVMSKGSIIEIKKVSGKWTSIEYLKLPTAPDAFDLDSKNNFIIVTSSSLLSVDSQKKIDTLIAEGIWHGNLYPSSLVIKNDVVFIGMRKGVFKYNLSSKKDEWLLP